MSKSNADLAITRIQYASTTKCSLHTHNNDVIPITLET